MSYKDLKSYQQAKIIYDFSVKFCDKYIDKFSRTHDQMVQAARSGKQNISEGAAQKDEGGERKLTKIARGSLEELLEDYKDFLRQNDYSLWGKDSDKAEKVKKMAYRSDKSYKTYKPYISEPEKAANAMVCLINQTNYLLDQQIRKLEEKPPRSEKDKWFKKKHERERKKEKNDFEEMLEKEGQVYTKRGIMDKEEAEERGLEEIDLPPVG